jgi:outer membrane lipoprotein-sorting protein
LSAYEGRRRAAGPFFIETKSRSPIRHHRSTTLRDVSQLGDLLEVVHSSRRSFKTFRGHYRLWRDERLAQEAFLAAAEAAKARGGSSVTIISTGPGEEPAPTITEAEWRIWLERPDRVREEFDGQGFGCPLAVRVGSRWWAYDRWNGAITNEGEEGVGSGVGDTFGAWLEPASILGLLELEPLGDGKVAARQAITARATRPTAGMSDEDDLEWSLHRLGVSAEEYELAIDSERGVILRLEARHGGEPYFVGEAESVAFDEPIAAETFVFTPPEGEEVRPLEPVTPEFNQPIEAVVQRAPFAVYVPARVPWDWEFRAIFVDAQERPPQPASVVLHYGSEDGTASVTISEHAEGTTENDEASSESAPPLERIERNGVTIEVRRRTAEWPQSSLSVVRDGTEISMFSDDLAADVLIELAANLVPARAEPPRL